jgi:hypothetical protein
MDEPREDWRTRFTPLLAPLIGNCTSISEAALRINQVLWSLWTPAIHFQADQTPGIMSPSQVWPFPLSLVREGYEGEKESGGGRETPTK